jgi:O-methyltransferase
MGETGAKRIVVFRFDRDPFICRSRVMQLRELNPGVEIHGLYGGGPGYRKAAFRLCGRPIVQLDSFYASRHAGQWNWRNGDLALAAWYRDVGRRLDFDVAHLVEWDLLLLDPLERAYAHVPADHLGLTCLTPVSRLQGRWEWLRGPDRLREWELLLAHARTAWGHAADPLACLGVGPCFPRAFLDAYAALDPPELGNDELRLPLAAQALGFRLVDTGFRHEWEDPEEDLIFNVGGPPVAPETVAAEVGKIAGRRAFHPVRVAVATPGAAVRSAARLRLGTGSGPVLREVTQAARRGRHTASMDIATAPEPADSRTKADRPGPVAAFAERACNRMLRGVGYRLSRVGRREPADFTESSVQLFRAVEPYTMTSPEAVYTLAGALRHVVQLGIPGAIVECGVWRGGSMMAAALTLLDLGRTDRELYLFDTFEGMPAPTDKDVRWTGEPAERLLASEAGKDAELLWARAGLDEVRQAMATVPYPSAKVHFVRGKVEETLPESAPETISVLRLDTDWYESSRYEMVHLYPRLSPGGVLILDDYGWWSGVRTAVDEYFQEHPPAPFLVRIDDSGARVAVKPNPAR